MNFKDMRVGDYYDIKWCNLGPYKFLEQRADRRKGYGGHTYIQNVLVFEDREGDKYEKDTAHGVSPAKTTLIAPVTVVPSVKKHLARTPDYDRVFANAELLATFLENAVSIRSGVMEAELDDELVPCLFIYPQDNNKMQDIIRTIILTNMEIG